MNPTDAASAGRDASSRRASFSASHPDAGETAGGSVQQAAADSAEPEHGMYYSAEGSHELPISFVDHHYKMYTFRGSFAKPGM